MKRYLIPLALAQLADVVTTGISLARGGYESNPVAVWLIAHGGLLSVGIFKAVFVLFAFGVLRLAMSYGGRYLAVTKTAIVLITVLIFLVAAWNVLVFMTL